MTWHERDDEPYTGPPPTGRHAAPPAVPSGMPAGGTPGPGPAGWGPAGPADWAPPGTGPAAWGPPGPGPAGWGSPAHGAWGNGAWGSWPQGPPPWPAGPGHWPAPAGWGPPPRPVLPPDVPPHDVAQPFLLAMRSRTWAWWRPLVGLLVLSVLYVVVAVVVVLLGVVGMFAAGGPDVSNLDVEDLTDPTVLLVTNLSLIVAIPVVWLVWVAAHGMRIGWSSSVLARLRWRLLTACVPLALIALVVAIGLPVLLGSGADDVSSDGPVASFGWLMLVVLLTTPLQSAAEEYVFRGYLSQAIAGWINRPAAGAIVAGVLTAALFSVAHVPPDLATFLDRFFFGLAASAVVWLTGGLEAAIVLHAVNNVVVFLLVGLIGDEVATDSVPAATALLDVSGTGLGLALYVAMVALLRRRLRPPMVTAAQDVRTPPRPQQGGGLPPNPYPWGPVPGGSHPWGPPPPGWARAAP